MKIEWIFFDNDGVLVNTEKLAFKGTQEAMTLMGITYTLKDFQETIFLTNKGSAGFLKDNHLIHRQAEFSAIRDRIWDPLLEKGGHLINGAIETLSTVKKSYNIALTTSAKKEKFMKMTNDCNLISHFNFSLFRDDCQAVKPDPEIYLKALKKAGVSAEKALVIEDTPRGVMAAKNAGIKVVAIPNAMTKDLDLSMADYRLESIIELPALLEKIEKETL